MVGSVISVVAGMTVGQFQYTGYAAAMDRPIATIAPYPSGMADDVHRPGFNGRLWVSRPVLGGRRGPYPYGWASPGPEAYGAFDQQSAVVYARVGHHVISISPWVQIHQDGLQGLEEARNFWLKEHGYTGGVRTFVNDLYMPQRLSAAESTDPVEAPAGLPTPRAVFELPADMPRMRSRIRVEAAGAPAVLARSDEPMRISWPHAAASDLVEKRVRVVSTVR